MRSLAVGVPPRWRCPRTTWRVSMPVRSSISPASPSATPPNRTWPNSSFSAVWVTKSSLNVTPSLTAMRPHFSPFSARSLKIRVISSRSGSTSGKRHVGGGGEACAPGDPTSVPSHHLDDNDPLVALCRRPELVYGVRGDGDGGIIAESRVRRRQVVVYCFGASHDLHPEVVVEPLGDAKRIVAAYCDEGIHAELLHLPDDLLGVAFVLIGVRARGAEDGAALLQDVAYVVHAERHDRILLGLK